MALTTDTPEMKRAKELGRHAEYLARMRVQDARHASCYCPTHPKYIGHNNVFPCTDPDHDKEG